MTPRPTLPITEPLRAWLRQDPGWSALPWRTRALLAWRAKLGTLNWRNSQAVQPPGEARLQPLFILGPWRSGSTAMHELLHAATGAATPRSWQCMDPSAFLLARRPPPQVAVARPMDGLPLGPQSPQEDEFALLGLGVDSAYRAFWQPQRLAELQATLDPTRWQADARWWPDFEAFLRGVLRCEDAGADALLLLKSPNHSFRLPALAQRWPQLRVVWMLRDARAVFLSNRKMWRQMMALHGLGPVDATALDDFLALALQQCAAVLAQLPTLLPRRQWALASQRALRDAPEAEVARVLAELGLVCEVRSPAWAAALSATASGRTERYGDEALPPGALAAIDALDAAQAAAQMD